MWIFTSKSFLSVVVDRSHPSRLLVRASVCHQTNLVTVAEEIAKRETRNQYFYDIQLDPVRLQRQGGNITHTRGREDNNFKTFISIWSNY